MRTMSVARALAALVLLGCGDDSEGEPLDVTWVFESGDCTSNGVETVHVMVSPRDGSPTEVELACADAMGTVGKLDGGTYGIVAEGLDADGQVVAESFGTTVTFGDAGPLEAIEVTLHPKSADVLVTWTLSSGGGCPPGVVLPYYLTLYYPPPDGSTEPTEKVPEVPEVQESCMSGQATLSSVPPGDYVVELDSRAVTPAIRGTAPVSVEPGRNTTVMIQL
jgi:hypothetical protein